LKRYDCLIRVLKPYNVAANNGNVKYFYNKHLLHKNVFSRRLSIRKAANYRLLLVIMGFCGNVQLPFPKYPAGIAA
jgi:hypothetical protein